MKKSRPYLLLFVGLLLNIAHAERDPARLTHGPMLGKPTAHTMTVWARTSDPTEFFVRYGVSESTRPSVLRGKYPDRERQHGTVTLVDLKADQRYFYQVYIKDRPHGFPDLF